MLRSVEEVTLLAELGNEGGVGVMLVHYAKSLLPEVLALSSIARIQLCFHRLLSLPKLIFFLNFGLLGRGEGRRRGRCRRTFVRRRYMRGVGGHGNVPMRVV
jgi:hypothetical protein